MGARISAEVRTVVGACYVAKDDLASFRKRLLQRIRRVVTVETAFFATVDPQTLLFTSASAEQPLGVVAPLFLANEYAATDDVNRFALLAAALRPAATLDDATRGDRTKSARFREIIAPLRLGDEMRVALRTGPTTWGFLCLHRAGALGFSARDAAILNTIAPHAGGALRRIVAGSLRENRASPAETAVVVVDKDVIIGMTGAAEAWLDELQGAATQVGDRAPFPLLAVVRKLEAIEQARDVAGSPHLTITTRRGSLLEVHAARMRYADGGAGAVVVTLASAGVAARSSLLLAVHGVTPAQRRVAELVLQGLSTRQIVHELRIGEHTVQDHLKVVFDKLGVASRRELVTALLR